MKRFMMVCCVLLLFFMLCGIEEKNYFTLQAQTLSDSVLVDTTFIVDFEATIGKVSGFGVDVVYDSAQIQYVSHETFDVFDHELIALQNGKQGRLIIGFNQFDCTKPVQHITMPIFSIKFHVKLTAEQKVSRIYFENKTVKLCDEDIRSEWYDLDFFVQDVNKFIMRMKIR